MCVCVCPNLVISIYQSIYLLWCVNVLAAGSALYCNIFFQDSVLFCNHKIKKEKKKNLIDFGFRLLLKNTPALPNRAKKMLYANENRNFIFLCVCLGVCVFVLFCFVFSWLSSFQNNSFSVSHFLTVSLHVCLYLSRIFSKAMKKKTQ